MAFFPVDLSIPPLPPVHLPPTPEVIDVPADLPTLEPDIVISFPLSEQVMDMVVVPAEHDGQDVIYVAVSQERVNVWAATVYFSPEIALGVTALVVLLALRKLWVSRRFTHRKGEAYCKKCWAGLTGVESKTCPECGRAIKKTRRVAKRSKRSLTHPRWRWALVALLLTLGTTILWFGESWHGLYRHGFDRQNPDDWWALVNPPDRDGPVRINRAAGWLSWYSADLAKHGRENDAAWIEMLRWEYQDGDGCRFHLVVRRFDAERGALLGEFDFPADTHFQDSDYDYHISLESVNGLVLVSGDGGYYRLRHGHAEPWVWMGDHQAPVEQFGIAVSGNGRYLFQTVAASGSNGQFGDVTDPQIIVYDTETGERLANARFTGYKKDNQNRRDDQRTDLETLAVQAPHYSFVENYGNVLPIEGSESVLLRLGPLWRAGFMSSSVEQTYTHTLVWDVANQSIEAAESETVSDYFGRGDFTVHSRIYGSAQFELNDDQHRELRIQSLRRSGMEWVTSDDLSLSPFGRDSDPSSIVMLYEIENELSTDLPGRILDVQHPRQLQIRDIALSPDGHWLTCDYSYLNLFSGYLPEAGLLVDIQSADAIGWLPVDIFFRDAMGAFVNDSEQWITWRISDLVPAPTSTMADRHEILIFDLVE